MSIACSGVPFAVPTVTGKDVGQASSVLGRIGLTVGGQRGQPDGTVAVGLVVGTDPAAGAQLKSTSTVTLLVSTGPDLGTVPQLVATTLAAGQDALKKAGLVAGAIRYRDGITEAGIVLKSTPDFGGKLSAGSAVELVVSSGNQRIPRGLVGQSAEAAAAAMASAGFSAQNITVPRSDVVPGIVVEVNPAAGSIQPLGSIVTLTESRWEQPPDPTPSGHRVHPLLEDPAAEPPLTNARRPTFCSSPDIQLGR